MYLHGVFSYTLHLENPVDGYNSISREILRVGLAIDMTSFFEQYPLHRLQMAFCGVCIAGF